MKYTLKIGEQIYNVEILDLKSRPILAIVDGEQFEVWPENGQNKPAGDALHSPPAPLPAPPVTGVVSASVVLSAKTVHAPIPGVVLEVSVGPGDQITFGQALFTIEAMKMRNVIRASRAGEVAEVFVTPGQTVNHNDRLLEFVE